jgi:hypothetical protein
VPLCITIEAFNLEYLLTTFVSWLNYPGLSRNASTLTHPYFALEEGSTREAATERFYQVSSTHSLTPLPIPAPSFFWEPLQCSIPLGPIHGKDSKKEHATKMRILPRTILNFQQEYCKGQFWIFRVFSNCNYGVLLCSDNYNIEITTKSKNIE